ncbi:hypothetical protein, partial [Aeromonas caviae]|uniref:hypothetical protein n=1 Tax=Aeromonas caviae TaxID=648 RepID=UPI0016296505
DLRCKVAHNKDFTKTALENVRNLASELTPILEKAISSLDNISVSDDEKDAVFEKVLNNYDTVFSKFMARFHKLDSTLDLLLKKYASNLDENNFKTTLDKIGFLQRNALINDRQVYIMHMARRIRNRLVHNDFDINGGEITHVQMMLEEMIPELEFDLNGSKK